MDQEENLGPCPGTAEADVVQLGAVTLAPARSSRTREPHRGARRGGRRLSKDRRRNPLRRGTCATRRSRPRECRADYSGSSAAGATSVRTPPRPQRVALEELLHPAARQPVLGCDRAFRAPLECHRRDHEPRHRHRAPPQRCELCHATPANDVLNSHTTPSATPSATTPATTPSATPSADWLK